MHWLFRRAKQKPKLRAYRAELRGGREREIALQATWQQEHPINGRPTGQVEELDRLTLTNQTGSEIIEYRGDGHVV